MATQTFAEVTPRIFQQALKQTSDIFTQTTALLMDAYSKQINMGYEFYKKLAETAPWVSLPSEHEGKTQWMDMIKDNVVSYQEAINNTMNQSKEIIEKIFSVFIENEWEPLSKKSTNTILNIFFQQAEQSKDFGTQFLNTLQNEQVLSQEAFEKQSALFNELMRESTKSSEGAIKELVSAYNKQASHTQEATKKLMANIQQQMDSLAKTQTKFTEELLPTLSAKKISASKTIKRTKSKK